MQEVSRQQAQIYQTEINQLVEETKRCRFLQCSAFSHKLSRCRLCIGKQNFLGKKRYCWHHEQPKELNRISKNGKLVLGFDEMLMKRADSWFADDAMLTALKILNKEANKARIVLKLSTENHLHELPYVNTRDAQFAIHICLLNNHWFVVLLNYITEKMFIFDSLYVNPPSNLGNLFARFTRFEKQMVENLPKQTNINDCGAFAIFFAYCLVYKKQIPARILEYDNLVADGETGSTHIRHVTVLFLIKKNVLVFNKLR